MNASFRVMRIVVLCVVIPVSGIGQTGSQPDGDSCKEECKELNDIAKQLWDKDWNLMQQAGRAAGAAEAMRNDCEQGFDARFGDMHPPAWMYAAAGTDDSCEAVKYWEAEEKRVDSLWAQVHKDRLEAEANYENCIAECEARKQ